MASKILIDQVSSFHLGMNSGLSPLLLNKQQLAFAFNSTVRGGLASARPPFTKSLTFAWESPLVQAAVEGGLFQGSCYYKPDTGNQCLIAQISGRLYRFAISGDVVSVSDISVPDDPNPSDRTQAWLWQAEKWVIVNDGESLPIFFDGTTSRRSYGPSQVIAEVAANAAIPEIGTAVKLTLVDDYTGPWDIPVLLADEYFQPIAIEGGYKAQITNVADETGSTYPIGQEVIARPSVATVVAADAENTIVASSPDGRTSLTLPAGTFSFTLQISAPAVNVEVGNLIQIASQATDGSGNTIDTRVQTWRITAKTASTLSLSSLAISVTGTRRVGYRITKGTIVSISGSTVPDFVIGQLTDTLDLDVGASAFIELDRAFTGDDNQLVFLNGNAYALTPAANENENANPKEVWFINLSAAAAPSPAIAIGDEILSVPELPPGRMGAYVMGQNWMSLTDGLKFIVSDLARGPSGTPANDYRDAVLKTVDLTFGGGAFAIPESGSYITSITQVPKLDESLGQGAVQIGTARGVFSASAPFDFYNPPDINTPILPQILLGFGPLGQNSTVLVNSDTFFRTSEGISSLIQARRDFQSWGNTSISEEVDERILSRDDEQLLPYGSAVVFDNRFLCTVSPQPSNAGVIHAGAVVINLDPVSSLRGKSQSVYDGLWTGVNVLQFVAGSFDNLNRAFAFGYNVSTLKIELYELLPGSNDNRFDNGYVPITFGFETAALFNTDIKPNEQLIRLEDGEIALDNVLGRVRVRVWYRFDQACWIPWRDFSICATTDSTPQTYPRLGLGQPNDDSCNNVTSRNAREGYTLQVRFQITGSCRFLRARFKAAIADNSEFSEPVCNEGCTPV